MVTIAQMVAAVLGGIWAGVVALICVRIWNTRNVNGRETRDDDPRPSMKDLGL